MPIAFMRFLDRWLGVPLCWLFSLLPGLRQGRIHSDVTGTDRLRRILIIKLSETGSLILAYPLVKALQSSFPGAQIHLLTFHENLPVLRVLGYVPAGAVLTIRHANPVVFLADFLGACLAMRRLRFDAVIDLEFFSRATALLTAVSGAPVRAGFHAQAPQGVYRGTFYTHRLAYRADRHVSLQFQGFARLLRNGTESDDGSAAVGQLILPPLFPPSAHQQARAEQSLRASGWLPAQPLLLVHAGDNNLPIREWPAVSVAGCIRRCLGQTNCFVVLVGGRGARKKAGLVSRLVADRRCVSFAGTTSIEELLALCTLARCLLASDAGLSHIASLTPVRKVILFGPESPHVFAPLPAERNRILFRNCSCSPCLSAFNHRYSGCRENRCVSGITPEEAAAHVCGLLGDA